MTEIELKLLLDAAAEERLRRSAALREMTRGRASTRRLKTVYHDTPDGRLRKAGIALRLRQTGARTVLTAKAGRQMRAGLQRVREVEIEVDEPAIDLSQLPDTSMRDDIIAALGGQAFGPVLETDIKRQSRTLEYGGSMIEFALDAGEVGTADLREPLCECEFELIEGEPQHLFDAAAAILDSGPVRLSSVSKAERAWRVSQGLPAVQTPEVRRARKAPLEAGQTTDAALAAIAAECLEQIAVNAHAVMVGGSGSRATHQLRVGLRRLRAALAMVRRADRPPRMTFLEDEARHLAQSAGRLRDLDVLRGEAIPAAGADADAAAGLDAALAGRAETARAGLCEALAAARTQRFLLELAAAAALGARRPRSGELGAGPLDAPAGETFEAALDRAWKTVRRRARKIANLDTEARHDLRKALKRLRYTVEFAAPLYSKDQVKPFLRQIKALQEVFGSLNDLAMAEAVLTGPDAPGLGDADAQRAAGLIIGAGRVRAGHDWEGARAAWKRLKKQGPFWRAS